MSEFASAADPRGQQRLVRADVIEVRVRSDTRLKREVMVLEVSLERLRQRDISGLAVPVATVDEPTVALESHEDRFTLPEIECADLDRVRFKVIPSLQGRPRPAGLVLERTYPHRVPPCYADDAAPIGNSAPRIERRYWAGCRGAKRGRCASTSASGRGQYKNHFDDAAARLRRSRARIFGERRRSSDSPSARTLADSQALSVKEFTHPSTAAAPPAAHPRARDPDRERVTKAGCASCDGAASMETGWAPRLLMYRVRP